LRYLSYIVKDFGWVALGIFFGSCFIGIVCSNILSRRVSNDPEYKDLLAEGDDNTERKEWTEKRKIDKQEMELKLEAENPEDFALYLEQSGQMERLKGFEIAGLGKEASGTAAIPTSPDDVGVEVGVATPQA
jgi:hypothetical protein